jgi:hypothetical protein
MPKIRVRQFKKSLTERKTLNTFGIPSDDLKIWRSGDEEIEY